MNGVFTATYQGHKEFNVRWSSQEWHLAGFSRIYADIGTSNMVKQRSNMIPQNNWGMGMIHRRLLAWGTTQKWWGIIAVIAQSRRNLPLVISAKVEVPQCLLHRHRSKHTVFYTSKFQHKNTPAFAQCPTPSTACWLFTKAMEWSSLVPGKA